VVGEGEGMIVFTLFTVGTVLCMYTRSVKCKLKSEQEKSV
jgi:hypothetical protein